MELEKEKAEKQLKELMARFKLRKALLHWRHRKLTLSFRSLVTMVFRHRIEQSRRRKETAAQCIDHMKGDIACATAARQKAEAAKRKSGEMLTRELALKKEGDGNLSEAQYALSGDAKRVAVAALQVAKLQSSGGHQPLGVREKDEVLQLMTQLQQLTADTDWLQLQLKQAK